LNSGIVGCCKLDLKQSVACGGSPFGDIGFRVRHKNSQRDKLDRVCISEGSEKGSGLLDMVTANRTAQSSWLTLSSFHAGEFAKPSQKANWGHDV
jgi:hypothetical protein